MKCAEAIDHFGFSGALIAKCKIELLNDFFLMKFGLVLKPGLISYFTDSVISLIHP